MISDFFHMPPFSCYADNSGVAVGSLQTGTSIINPLKAQRPPQGALGKNFDFKIKWENEKKKNPMSAVSMNR